jgi:hypothetical protein
LLATPARLKLDSVTAGIREMTLGAEEPAAVGATDGPSPSGTGFYVALAAWIPLGLFLLLVATPPTQSGDCGFWGRPTNNAFAEGLLLVPGTPVILGLAAWPSAALHAFS